LRQFQLEPDTLFQAFIRTGREVIPSPEQLLAYAQEAIFMAKEGQLTLFAHELEEFIGWMQASGFPAMHHSRTFEEAYQPAYRVVAWDLLPPDWLAIPL